jgi:acetolactate synthase-1/2/3 large subunit
VAEAIEKAESPLICAGGGVINANASEELLKFAEKYHIPVVNTLMGIGSVPFEHELNMGMLGSHGVYTANYAVNNSDLLILLGARVGDRAMGSAVKIAKKASIVHIDIDPAEIGKNIPAMIPVVGDVKTVLEELSEAAVNGNTESWLKTLEKKKTDHPLRHETLTNYEYIRPQYVLKELSRASEENTIVTTEVGQNQIWTANHYRINKARTFISSGGLGTMGYGLPSAVGAKVGNPDKRVIVIAGDGSFQMSMQELGTIKQNKLGIKIIIFNNSRLGMVRELQKRSYCGRYSQVFLDENPDFVKLVSAYGFKGESIRKNSEVVPAINRMLADDDTYLLEFIVNPEESTL